MPSAAGGVIDHSVGHSAFRKIPTVPQPTSADFVPQITFRIPHFRKLPTPSYTHPFTSVQNRTIITTADNH